MFTYEHCHCSVGLIGGSVAIRLKETKFCDKIIGVDKSQKNLDKAMHIGFIDETASLEDAIKSCKVLVLTIPVDAILHVVPQILDLVTDQVVIDMGSTKTNILNKIKDHPNRGRYVAAIPWPEQSIRGLRLQYRAYSKAR